MNILITEKEFHEYRTLQKQLSQLQQENQQLKEKGLVEEVSNE